MSFKRLLALVISLVMLLTFCGCGDKKGGGKGSGDITSADVDEITFEGLKFEIDKNLDFGGKTVKIARP